MAILSFFYKNLKSILTIFVSNSTLSESDPDPDSESEEY